jgi:hypothetical protein
MTDKIVTLLRAIVWYSKYADKKLYLLIAYKNSKPKIHLEYWLPFIPTHDQNDLKNQIMNNPWEKQNKILTVLSRK